MRLHATAFAVFPALPAVSAWGSLGHATVAYIASNYVSNTTRAWAQELLNDTSASYMSSVASWADSYRSTTAGKFSAPFHFLDAEDNAPSSCNVDYERDCSSEGCVVSAIANYTHRVTTKSISKSERTDALKFLIHFVGDIHQPLHNEAYALGGNQINVTFQGAARNLHGIWDTQMPVLSRNGANADSDASAWANELIREIDTGVYASSKRNWTEIDAADPVGQSLEWSTQANSYVCSTVVPSGWDAVEQGDLATNGYYDNVLPVIEIQIARAGVRLAAWLDAISGAKSMGNSSALSFDPLGEARLPPKREISAVHKIRRAADMGCGCDEH